MRCLATLLLALLFSVGCEPSAPVNTPTQVTVRITASDSALRGMITQLRVRAAMRLAQGGWRTPVVNSFNAAGLTWPVDVPVFPRNADEAANQIEIVAQAVQSDRVIAEARAITSFLPGRYVTLELHLMACPRAEAVCSPGCVGTECTVCNAAGECERVAQIDPGSLMQTPVSSPGSEAGIVDVQMDGGAIPMSGDSGVHSDAAVPVTPDAQVDAATVTDDSGGPPAAECSGTTGCTAGFVCTNMRCVSACTQTQCDPNATCSLVVSSPVCTCNAGFIAMTGTGGAVTCLKDVACGELGCDVNATCVLANQVRHCECKNGYTGSGMSCTPVSCPPPTIVGGTASATAGSTFDNIATYQCNTGFSLVAGGSWSRRCGANMMWSGTQPACAAITCTALSAPQNGSVSTAQGREYGDVAIYTCDSGYKLQGTAQQTCGEVGWSGTAPTCTKTCGNGALDTGEQCDPMAPGQSPWTCMPTTCQFDTQRIYRPCESNADCGTGQACASGTCVIPACTSTASCPATPLGSGANATCYTSPQVCLATCATASNCAPGLTCSVGRCIACSDGTPCGNGQTCVLYGAASIGRCY